MRPSQESQTLEARCLPASDRCDITVEPPFYARIGVANLGFIDREARALVASRLGDGNWLEIGVYDGDAPVRAPPFEAIEISFSDWEWPAPEVESGEGG